MDAPATSAKRFEGFGGAGLGPELIDGDKARLTMLFLDQARHPEKRQERRRRPQIGQDSGEKQVWDHRAPCQRREAIELAQAAHSASSMRSTQSSNFARRSRKRSSTVPVGPLRCLAMITSATPRG